MRIFYDYQAFSRQVYGGVSRYFVEMAKHLSARNGLEVKIIAPLHINHYLHRLDSGIVSGKLVPHVPKSAGKLLNVYNRIASRHWLDKYRPDILHETYFSAKPLVASNRQTTVVSVYDMIHERFPEYFTKLDKTAVTKRLAVERADHVICISDTTRKDLLDITGISHEKVSVVHLGFDTPLSSASMGNSLIDGDYILHVGIRSGYKNFARLLNAYGNNPVLHKNFKLVCFGGGKPSHAEERQRRILGLPDDRLHWIGGNDQVLGQLYSHASAFVYPSLYEGFGIPPLEAMARNCPVICSNGGSIPEVVGSAGEFFDPYDEHDIAQSIQQVATSPERCEALRILGRERIASFTWSRCASETCKIYEKLTKPTMNP